MTIYIGIDNGLNGGIVAINENQIVVTKDTMPVITGEKKKKFNINEINNIFSYYSDIDDYVFVCLEEAHPRPISGKKQCFNTGYGYGIIQGLLCANFLGFELVTPQKWMKELGIAKSKEKGSVLYCKNRFPNENWCSGKSKKIHDGLTDAMCLAIYCYRKNRGVDI